MNAIHVEGLTRKFGDFTAVKGISFDVHENEVFGFLGPNGAGKTTTINMLCTLLRPSGGAAQVGGIDVSADPGAVRQSIGLIFQDPSLDEQLTGRENLRFHAMLYNVSMEDFRRRSDELLTMVELTEKADDLVRTYSGGMKRRLEISRGLLHRPKVLFLDEPTLGLDPQTRRHIWEYLFRLRERRGITMFMTTHYMDEAENCDRIAIIDHGQIVALDTPESLKGLVGGDIVTVRTSNNDAAISKLTEMGPTATRRGPEGQVIVETDKGDQFIPHMMAILADGTEPVEVHSVNLRRPTLEDVFIKLTGRAIREEDASPKDRMRTRRRRFRG
jgi:ABC-2 type transport system ATP-binding protein